MTVALTCYSAVFMRYALAVTPKNYLLFACHIINFSAQATQGYRYINYWKYVPSLWLSRLLLLIALPEPITLIPHISTEATVRWRCC